MDHPHANSSNDESESFLGWFDMDSFHTDEDIGTSIPNSPPLNIVVPDSLDPDDLGMHVAETEFQEPVLFVPKSPEFDVITGVDDGCRSDRKKGKKRVTISDSYKTLMEKVAEKRKRLDEQVDKMDPEVEKLEHEERLYEEQLPETRSSFRLRQYEERYLARLKKSSN